MVVDLLKTHPKVVVSGVVVENPYCLTPDEFLAAPHSNQQTSLEDQTADIPRGLRELATNAAS
jgi:hypothetical protein